MDNEFFSPLTVVKRLGPLCLAVMLFYTFGWTAFVARHEVTTGDHPDLSHTAIAAANGAGQVDGLILLYSIATTVALDILGGMILVTARYLENKFVKPLIERHKAEGRAEGIEAGRAEGRAEGIETGIAAGRAEGRAEGMETGVKTGIETGIATGEAAERRRWTEWNDRRLDAEREGVPFNEPPPSG